MATQITVTIAGTDRSSLVEAGSLDIVSVLTSQPDTANFTIRKFPSRSFAPSVGEEVIITDSAATKLFAGKIVEVREQYEQLSIVSYAVTCTDYTRDLDNKLIVDVFEDMTVSAIISFIITNYLPTAFTMANVTSTGTINYLKVNYETASQVLRRMAEMLNCDWYVDYDRDIHFFQKESTAAPFNLTDSNGNYIYESLRIRRDLSQLRNVVIVRGGEFLGNTITAAFVADGAQRHFWLPYKMADLTLSVTGQAKSVGVDPIDNESAYDALHNFQEKVVIFRESRKPTLDSAVRIGGRPYLPVISKVSDDASAETFTAREHLIVDKSIATKEGARQRAYAELLLYKTTISEGSFQTYKSGLKPGQLINIQSTLRGIDEDFIISRVRTRIFGYDSANAGEQLVYQADLMTTRTFDHIQLLQKLLNDKKTEIVIAPDEVIDEVKNISEEMTLSEVITASLSHNPISESMSIAESIEGPNLDYQTEFVLGPYIPTSITPVAEFSNTVDNTSFPLYTARKFGQNFTTVGAFTVGKVAFKAARVGSPGNYTIAIYATSGGLPTGSPLTSVAFDGDSVSTSLEEIFAFLPGYDLAAATVYALTIVPDGGNASNYLALRYNNSNVVAGDLLADVNGDGWDPPYNALDAYFKVFSTDYKRQFILDGSLLD